MKAICNLHVFYKSCFVLEPKKNLLLLHGALGCEKQMEALRENLSDHFTLHSLDFEGHGRRTSAAAFTMNLFCKNLGEYLDRHAIESSCVFGYSMGGYVALNYALQYHGRLEKIVTLGTKFDWTPESAAAECRKLNPEKMEEKIPVFTQHLKKLHPANDWKSLVRKTADLMQDLGNHSALQAADFRKIQTPVLLCLGEYDQMVSVKESQDVAEQLQNGRLKILSNQEHPFEKVDLKLLSRILLDELL